MIVITDTSPLNYLVRLGCAELLADLFGSALAPSAVLAELTHPEAPPEVKAWASAPPPWLEIRSVHEIDPTLPTELGAESVRPSAWPWNSRPDCC